jgi:HK97 family phage major capsid protein
MEDLTKIVADGIDGVKTTLSTQVKETESRLEKLIEKASEEAKLNGKSHGETLEAIKTLEASNISMRERLDTFEKSANRLKGGADNQTFMGQLTKSLTDNQAQLQEFKNSKRAFSLDIKATMSQADNLVEQVIPPTRVPGVKFNPERATRVRQFLPQGTTDSNSIFYVQETSYTDGTNITKEIYTKPESSFVLTQKSANVVKIATHFRVSEEMLNDVSYLASHIGLRGTEKYLNKEDQQLLYGTGSGGQLEGLTVSSTGYTLGYVDAFAQEYDILMEAAKQIRNANFIPAAAMVSINRYFDMIRRKDKDGRYILPDGVVFENGTLRVAGLPIIPTNALANNDFLVADFAMMTTLFDREGISVRFYEQDQDNAVKNLVTVVIEGRIALPTYLPDAGRFGNFATAISNAGNS